jgi:hypothetical protein
MSNERAVVVGAGGIFRKWFEVLARARAAVPGVVDLNLDAANRLYMIAQSHRWVPCGDGVGAQGPPRRRALSVLRRACRDAPLPDA